MSLMWPMRCPFLLLLCALPQYVPMPPVRYHGLLPRTISPQAAPCTHRHHTLLLCFTLCKSGNDLYKGSLRNCKHSEGLLYARRYTQFALDDKSHI